MITKLKSKLKKEGRTLVWFHKNFIKSYSYMYMIQMLNGIVKMQTPLEKSISKYLDA